MNSKRYDRREQCESHRIGDESHSATRTRDACECTTDICEHKFMWLVIVMAKKAYRKYNGKIDIGILISDGYLGLRSAIKNFDSTRSKFTTYAGYRILGAISDGIISRRPGRRQKHRREELPFDYSDGSLDNMLSYCQVTPNDPDDFWKYVTKFLSKKQRAVLLMYYRDGLSLQEIADKLECTRGNVCSQVSQARARLRDISEEEFRARI